MPNFSYKAVDQSNKIQTGTITAPTTGEVSAELQKKGLKPISIKSETTFKTSQSTVPPIERISFSRYVSTMLAAGLSLTEGISVLKEDAKHPVMKQILNDILYHLERGQSLSQALALYPKVFDQFFLALVKAGEISGTLADSFKYLEEKIRAEYSLNQKIKGALVYPAFIFAAMLGIGGIMLFFVMPQIGKVFLSMTVPIPEFTRIMFQTSITMSMYRIQIVIGVILLIVSLMIFLKQPAGKELILKIIHPIPVIKNLIHQMDVARFCRIFSTLIASAVPVTESLQIALTSLANPMYHTKAKLVVDEVMQGRTIASVFKEQQLFPPLLIQMIAGGEKSGTLDKTLSDLSAFYEGEVEESVKKSTQLLEPLLMLAVGIGVGAMILSIIAPMYSVVGSLQNVK
jgi:type II secretory pathway component PulF